MSRYHAGRRGKPGRRRLARTGSLTARTPSCEGPRRSQGAEKQAEKFMSGRMVGRPLSARFFETQVGILARAFSPPARPSFPSALLVAERAFRTVPERCPLGQPAGRPAPALPALETYQGPVANPDPRTLADALDAWGRGLRLCPGGTAQVRGFRARWARMLGHLPLSEVLPRHVREYYASRDDGIRSAYSLRHERGYLAQFFTWAAESRLLLESPVTVNAWPRKKGPQKRRTEEALTFEEEDRLCAALPPVMVAFVRFNTANGGMRAEEIRHLEAGMLGADGVLHIPGRLRKQQVDHRIPLAMKALQTIRALGPWNAPSARIFEGLPGYDAIRKALLKAGKKAGLPKRITCTSLRSTWVARMDRAGTPTLALQI